MPSPYHIARITGTKNKNSIHRKLKPEKQADLRHNTFGKTALSFQRKNPIQNLHVFVPALNGLTNRNGSLEQ